MVFAELMGVDGSGVMASCLICIQAIVCSEAVEVWPVLLIPACQHTIVSKGALQTMYISTVVVTI